MDAWNIDVVLSASQKGLGAPPGLCVLIASQKALKVDIKYGAKEYLTKFTSRLTKPGRLPSLASTPAGRGVYLLSSLSGLSDLPPRWLPIMQAYEAGKPAYFATPPVNLIRSYQTSLTQIVKSPTISLQDRFELHRKAAQRIRQLAAELGLNLVPTDPYFTANGMTAVSASSALRYVRGRA